MRSASFAHATIPCALALMCLFACGDDGTSSSGTGGESAACTPGQQIACACSAGLSGTQVCNNAGTAYLACTCGTTTTASTSSGESTTVGSGGDDTTSSAQGGSTGVGGETSVGGGSSTSVGSGTGGGGGGDPLGSSWLLGFGDAGYEQGIVALSPRFDGGSAFVLRARGTFPIGDGRYASPNDVDTAVVSIDAAGTVEGFARIVGAGDAPEASGVAALSDRSVVVAGRFCAPTDFGDGLVVPDECDGFLAHYDVAGMLLGVRVVGGPFLQGVERTVAFGDDVYAVIGTQGTTIDVGDGPVTSESGSFLARLAGGTDPLWVRGFDLSPTNGASGGLGPIDVDATAGVAVAGTMANGGLDLGGGFLIGPTEQAHYVARFDLDGAPLSSFAFTCSGTSVALDLASDGSIAMLGGYVGACDLPGLDAAPTNRDYQVRFDGDDVLTFASGEDRLCRLVPFIDGPGLLLAGTCTGEVDFGAGVTTPNGDELDYVTVHLDADGSPTDVKRCGPSDGSAEYTERGPTGDLILGGRTCVDIDLGFGSMQHQGSCDAWAARIDQP